STPGHLWHESAAWNVAVGAGFMWIALLRARPAGALPMLTAFLGFLGLVSVQDLVADRVDGVRLFSHGLILVGYLITLALSRPGLDPGRPPADVDRPERRGGTARLDEADEPSPPPRLRLIRGEASVSPTRHRAA
ncbi:MAG TPA: hypothetical protein VFW27_00020, partial [Actinoplanes sp.]|nr:hypothetical protein [Actinoplanes sp.]